MATHSSILLWEIPWIEEPVHGVAKSQIQLNTQNTFNTYGHGISVSVLTWPA